MDIFVEFCLERFQKLYAVVNIVGDPVLPSDLEVGHSYLLFDINTDRESSDSIPVHEPELRVNKVVLESCQDHFFYFRQYRFRFETPQKNTAREFIECCHTEMTDKCYVVYKYTEDYACK